MILGIKLPHMPAPPLYTYPARPFNGGPLDNARPKRGTWATEPKGNGWRGLVHVPSGAMFNRQGKLLSIASDFESALEILRATLDAEAFKWVDCECFDRRHAIARGTLIVLDVIPEPVAYRSEGDHAAPDYRERRSWLTPLPVPRSLIEINRNTVYLTPSTLDDPQTIWNAARAANRHFSAVVYEGIVMKRIDSLYPVQLRNPEECTPAWIKHRWHF